MTPGIVDGRVLLVALALLVALVIAGRNSSRARRADARQRLAAKPADYCDTTGCPYAGWIPVTRRATGESAEVCAGCWAEGQTHGWWTT